MDRKWKWQAKARYLETHSWLTSSLFKVALTMEYVARTIWRGWRWSESLHCLFLQKVKHLLQFLLWWLSHASHRICVPSSPLPVQLIYKLVGGHQTPVHLHDEVHDGESKREKGENGKWVSTATSPSKLSWTCLPPHQTLSLEHTAKFKKHIPQIWLSSQHASSNSK